ncbi:hypothetical protein PybrP1_009892 [[Pythium] brassicae (nom. inval.)]|nr:hypothetical protein PybrP1_009892 [[Pythium] brassicae (nom. inval.)]
MSSSLLRDWDEGASPRRLSPSTTTQSVAFAHSAEASGSQRVQAAVAASKSRRKRLLEWFQRRFQLAPFSGELESECGADASLLLARVLVWMQTTTAPRAVAGKAKRFFALSEQLACVQIFLASANAHVYFREFQQANGLALLVSVLQAGGAGAGVVSDADRLVVLDLLFRVSQRGRAHKEAISRCEGELAVIRGALAGSERCANMASPLWEACRDTLLEQMVGNSNCHGQTHTAIAFMLGHAENELRVFGAQILRHLITPDSFYLSLAYRRAKQTEIVSLAIETLESNNTQLQHEGLELVHSLLQSESLRRDICKVLVEWAKRAAVTPDVVDERFASVQSSREFETFSHIRSPFVRAAQSLSTLMNSTPAILPLLVAELELLVPLAFVLVVERSQSLKWYAAAIAIHYVFTSVTTTAAAHLAQLFSLSEDKLLAWRTHEPEHLARSLLQSEDHRKLLVLRFYQNGWRRPVESTSAARSSASAGEEDAVECELRQLELEVESTVRDFVPELQMRGVAHGYDPEDDDTDLFCDSMDAEHEQQLRAGLQRHFLRFRGALSGSV